MEKISINKLYNHLKEYFFLYFILLLALCLRWYGIYFDYPYGANVIWDELENISNILRISEQKNLFVSNSTYPILMTFLYFPTFILRVIYISLREGIFSVSEIKNYLLGSGMGQIYILTRWYSVAMGTGLVYITYKIYYIIFRSKISAYYSALVISTNIVLVYLFHWGKLQAPMLFFLGLSLYFALLYEKNKQDRFFYLSAIFSAFSLSSHYVGLSSVIFPLALLVFNYKNLSKKTIYISILLAFLIVSYSYLLAGQNLRNDVLRIFHYNYSSNNYIAYFPVGVGERFYYLFRDIFEISPIFLLLFFPIFIIKFKYLYKHQFLRYVFWGIIFNYILMISVFTAPERARMLAIFIFLSFSFTSATIADILKRKMSNKKIIYYLPIVLILPSVFITLQWLSILKSSTNEDLIKWLDSNLSRNEIAYALERSEFNADYSYEAVEWEIEQNGNVTNKRNYIFENKEIYEGKGINLFYDDNHLRYQHLAGKNTKYVIVQFWQNGEHNILFKNTTQQEMIDKLNEVRKFHDLELAQKFYPTKNNEIIANDEMDYVNNPLRWWNLLKIEKSGTYIEVYQVLN